MDLILKIRVISALSTLSHAEDRLRGRRGRARGKENEKASPFARENTAHHMDMALEISTGRVYLLTWWTVIGRIVSSYRKNKTKTKTELLIP